MLKSKLRLSLFLFSALALIAIFLFQRFNYANFIFNHLGLEPSHYHPYTLFSVNKFTRFILNDAMAILMIYAIFYQRKYVIMAVIVQLFGMLILMPTYLYLNYHFYSETKPWLNFLHRLTLNPTLLMLLIPAFWYQREVGSRR